MSMADGSFALPPAGDATPDYQDRDANGLVWADMSNLLMPTEERQSIFNASRQINPNLRSLFQNPVPMTESALKQELEMVRSHEDLVSAYKDVLLDLMEKS